MNCRLSIVVTPESASSLPLNTVAEIGVTCGSVLRRSAVTTTSGRSSVGPTSAPLEATVCPAELPHQPSVRSDAPNQQSRIFMGPLWLFACALKALGLILTLLSEWVNIHSHVSDLKCHGTAAGAKGLRLQR